MVSLNVDCGAILVILLSVIEMKIREIEKISILSNILIHCLMSHRNKVIHYQEQTNYITEYLKNNLSKLTVCDR